MQGFCFDSGREPGEDLGQLLCLDLFHPEESTMRTGTMTLGQRRKLDVAAACQAGGVAPAAWNHLSPALSDDP
jgi:hypothetical protein